MDDQAENEAGHEDDEIEQRREWVSVQTERERRQQHGQDVDHRSTPSAGTPIDLTPLCAPAMVKTYREIRLRAHRAPRNRFGSLRASHASRRRSRASAS